MSFRYLLMYLFLFTLSNTFRFYSYNYLEDDCCNFLLLVEWTIVYFYAVKKRSFFIPPILEIILTKLILNDYCSKLLSNCLRTEIERNNDTIAVWKQFLLLEREWWCLEVNCFNGWHIMSLTLVSKINTLWLNEKFLGDLNAFPLAVVYGMSSVNDYCHQLDNGTRYIFYQKLVIPRILLII